MEATNMKSVEKNIASVALADIQPSNYNPRKTFDEASLAELAESIRQQGVLQPIGVRPIDENRFEVVFGALLLLFSTDFMFIFVFLPFLADVFIIYWGNNRFVNDKYSDKLIV